MALAATSKTQLAYVVTGNSEIDETSRAGLEGLSRYLADRTALEPGEPAAVDIATDELAFYALIYWPIDPDQPTPSAETMAKVDTFMKNGGTILFDTRDAGGFSPAAQAATRRRPESCATILAFVDVPPLEPVPPDHVLTKAFYLLSEFPGRWANSELWVESLTDAPQDREPPGARRRRRLADHHHRQRPRRPPGRSMRTGSGSTRPSPPIRASASSPSAPASTS